MRANNLLLKLKNFGCGKVTNDDVARFGIKVCFLNKKRGKYGHFVKVGLSQSVTVTKISQLVHLE